VIRLAALVAVAFLVVGALDARQPERYAPDGGQFEVKFPGPPKPSTTDAKSKLGKLKVFTATFANSDSNVFMVSYTDFPEGTAKGSNAEVILEGARTGLKGKDGEILDSSPRGFGAAKIDGHEILVRKDRQRVRMWILLRGDRLFQVGVIGTPEFVKSKEADAFLKSFDLTK
jgi:hypothetical protein